MSISVTLAVTVTLAVMVDNGIEVVCVDSELNFLAAFGFFSVFAFAVITFSTGFNIFSYYQIIVFEFE